jgi:Domain of unknown function (DUF892)
MEMETLRDLYVDELKDLWSAEKQILQALPRMIRPPRLGPSSNCWRKAPSWSRSGLIPMCWIPG